MLNPNRDCMFMNIMLDPKPLYPNLFHPTDPARSRDWKGSSKHYSRTTHPVRYVIIDFGISRRYRPEDLPPCEPPIISADKSVPENQKGEPCNPFPTDVYLIGNLLREWFLQVRGKGYFPPTILIGLFVSTDLCRLRIHQTTC